MDLNDFLRHLDELFELDAGSVQAESCFQDLPEWSSLTFMGLIAMVDDEYAVTLSPAVILKCRTAAELFAAIGDTRRSNMAA